MSNETDRAGVAATVRDTVRGTDVEVEQTGNVKVRGAGANVSDNPNPRKR